MTSIAPRTLLTDFALANPLYANASITVYEADGSTWQPTTTLASLYTGPSGTAEHGNPLLLDGDGKYRAAVYVDRAVISRVTGAAVPAHDTGVIGLQPAFRGAWAASTDYNIAEIVRDGAASSDTGRLYIAATTHTSSSNFAADLVAGSWTLYLDASTPVDYDDTIVSLPTGFFFEDEGARVHRLSDRLFLGAATANDGSTLGGGSTPDWFSAGSGVSAGLAWVAYLSTVALVSPNGTVGFSAASRASDVPGDLGTHQISIPFVGIGIMDRTGSGPPYWTSYGAYFEGRIEPVSASIGTVIGVEIDAINFGGAVGESTPWRMQTLGGATALWLASGGDPANHGRTIGPAQMALGIVDNGETFESGIVISRTAIEGTDGSLGFGAAINLATRHILGWYAEGGGNGQRVSYITSTNTVPGHSLQFQDGATLFLSAAGKIDLAIGNVANSVNGMGLVPATAGNSPYIETFGDDAAPNLDFKPQGAGNARLFAQNFLFMADDGNQLAYVQAQVSANTYEQGLIFADGGPFFYGRGSTIVGFGMVASAVNRLSLSNSATGNAVSITAQGTDSDIDILLDPAGSAGTLKLAVPTATSANIGGASALPGAPAAYLIVKDGAGTSLAVAAWNI